MRGETLNDWGIVVPLGEMIGAVGFSQNRMHYQSNDEFFWDESVYKLHYAREFYEQLAFGVSINYYRFYQDNGSYANQRIYRNHSLDVGLSGLYSIENLFRKENDILKIGIQLQNLFDTRIVSQGYNLWGEKKHQNLRIGISYAQKYTNISFLNLRSLKILFAVDNFFRIKNYTPYLWQPNFGLELSITEYLMLRFGRQNQKEIKNVYPDNTFYPNYRFGYGVMIPIDRILKLKDKLRLKFDFFKSYYLRLSEPFPPGTEGFSIKLEVL